MCILHSLAAKGVEDCKCVYGHEFSSGSIISHKGIIERVRFTTKHKQMYIYVCSGYYRTAGYYGTGRKTELVTLVGLQLRK